MKVTRYVCKPCGKELHRVTDDEWADSEYTESIVDEKCQKCIDKGR